MKSSINSLQEVIERKTSATVMTLEVGVILHDIKIPPCLILVLLRVTTDRAAKVVKVILDLLEFLQTRGN
tara:strand:- start:426 stop:635 length:210 start_codon:yes stop_codon:yes gene_type:complete